MDTVYKNKYLKYKNKYLESQKIQQIGGAFPFKFGDGNILYIMAKIDGTTLDRINERRIAFSLPNNDDLHISLLQLYLNNKHPLYSAIFLNDEFKKVIKTSYKNNISKNNVILQSVDRISKKGKWEFLGILPNIYWARVYDFVGYENYIKQFRLDIYNYIISKAGLLNRTIEKRSNSQNPADVDDFVIYKTQDGNELYAIHKNFYFGVDNWKPHVSVISIPELEKSGDKSISDKSNQNSLIYKFNSKNTDDEKTDLLRYESSKRATAAKATINPISNINLNSDVKKIKLSINDIKQKSKIEEYLPVSIDPIASSTQSQCTIM